MRAIFLGLFLALLMVLVVLVAIVDLTCEQARAPSGREVAIKVRKIECEITTIGDTVFWFRASVEFEDGARAEGHMRVLENRTTNCHERVDA